MTIIQTIELYSPEDKREAAMQAVADFGQQWEQLENARLIIEKQARMIADLEDANASEVRVSRVHEIRIAELEAALDKAINALSSGLVIPTGEIAKLREVRK